MYHRLFFFHISRVPEELVTSKRIAIRCSVIPKETGNTKWKSLMNFETAATINHPPIAVSSVGNLYLVSDFETAQPYRWFSRFRNIPTNKFCGQRGLSRLSKSKKNKEKSQMGISETSARATPEMLNTWTIKNGRKYLVVTTENWWAKLGPCWKHFTSLRKPLSSSNADKNKNCAIIYIKSATMARSPHQFV